MARFNACICYENMKEKNVWNTRRVHLLKDNSVECAFKWKSTRIADSAASYAQSFLHSVVISV